MAARHWTNAHAVREIDASIARKRAERVRIAQELAKVEAELSRLDSQRRGLASRTMREPADVAAAMGREPIR